MTKKIAWFVAVVLISLGFSNSSNATIIFSATSVSVAAGSSSVTTEIRVSGLPTDTLQYFAIRANVVTLTGGKTLTFGATTQAGSNTNRAVLPYVLAGRGTSVTGAPATFAFNASNSSVSFRDGVSIPFTGPPGYVSTPVAPGTAPGLLVATLQFNASSALAGVDSFRIDLSALTANTDNFANSNSGLPPGIAFTGAATGRDDTIPGTDLNLGATSFSSGIVAVPEPSTILLLGLSLAGTGFARFRKRLKRIPG